jgi:hypothetical protein
MTTAADAVAQLHQALEALARALGSRDADAVLAAEAPLAVAAAALAGARPVQSDDRLRLRQALLDAGVLIQRCRALGDSIVGVARASGPPAPYTRTGLRVISPHPATLTTRT